MKNMALSEELHGLFSKYARQEKVSLGKAVRELLCRERVVSFYVKQGYSRRQAMNAAQRILRR